MGLRDDIVLLGNGDKFLAVPDDRIDPLRNNGDDFPALELAIGVLLEGLVKFFFNPRRLSIDTIHRFPLNRTCLAAGNLLVRASSGFSNSLAHFFL